MINIRKALVGTGAAVFVALGLLAPQAQAAPAPAAPASIEVSSASLYPKATPPKVTKANTVKAKGTKSGLEHPGPAKTGGISTQSVGTCATWPTNACYNYAGGLQNFTSPTVSTGLYANIMVPWSYTDYPARDAGAHDVTELAVLRPRSVGGPRDIVEWGMVSDRAMSPTGNDEMRVFAFAWVNGNPQGWNAGFVNYTGANACAYHPGDSLGAINGTAHAFGIEYLSGAWWASIDGKYCGYFPADPAAGSTAGNLWYGSGANFVNGSQIQAFGEVTSALDKPCTDMGSGQPDMSTIGSPYNYATMPAYISTVSQPAGGPTTSLTAIDTPTGLPYIQQFLTGSVKSFYYTGAGTDSSGNLPGNRGSC
jgi:hypothetical protein